MDTKEALRAEYGVLLDRLKSMLDARLTESQHPVVMAVGVSSATKIAVLLDHDLQLMAEGRHPDGDEALVMVAHRALLLYAARRDAAAKKAAIEARVEEVQAKMGFLASYIQAKAAASASVVEAEAKLTGASAVACTRCEIQAEEDKAVLEGMLPRNKAPERVAARRAKAKAKGKKR